MTLNTLLRSVIFVPQHNPKQPKETLQPHEIPTRPWQRVGTDLFSWNGKEYLLVTDYYSLFPEVTRLRSTTSAAVIDTLKSLFARHGTPDVLVSDNGPQYDSEEFQKFCGDWNFGTRDVQSVFSSVERVN